MRPPARPAPPASRAPVAPSRTRATRGPERREPRTDRAATERRPPDLDELALYWQAALDAADRALRSSSRLLRAHDLRRLRHDLALERSETAVSLRRDALVTRVPHLPWLSPVPVSTAMLGLPAGTRACLFDLDGVLTDSGALHAQAWAEVFDDVLLRLSDALGWHFIPFDVTDDYRAYVDGRTRLDGIHSFLASRGIRLPEGEPSDPPETRTAHGLAARKAEALTRALHRRGVVALPGARRYLEAAGHAGLGRGVVSASTRTLPMLELAGLATIVDSRIDAEVIEAETLRPRPAPDLLIAACLRLGSRPEETVTFTHSPAGVAAGRSAGLTVVAVGEGETGALLEGYGAERVVPSLGVLLDSRIANGSAPAPVVVTPPSPR